MTRIFVLVLLTALGGCTFGRKEAVPIPAVMDSYFRICHPLSGALAIQIFTNGDLMGSAEVDWSSAENGWNIDVSNAAGFTVVNLQESGGTVKAEGPQAKNFPAVSVDDSGFLIVDGNFVGIKSREIPCFLQGALPRAWTPLVNDVTATSDRRARIEINDDEREIIVRTKNIGDEKSEEICANVTWRNKLIFKSEIRWCVSGAGLKRGAITGLGNYSVKWVRFDD